MNITTSHPGYIKALNELPKSARNNGAFYYSQELEKNVVPKIKTKREWNLVGRDLDGMHDGMIVILHDNATPWHYDWLKKYKDLILVCSSNYTKKSVEWSGKTILLPMSIDTKYVKKFRAKKTRDVCIVGNAWVRQNLKMKLPKGVDILSGLPRNELLERLARYKEAYCIDRCAMEARTLKVEVLFTPARYGCTCDPFSNEVLDNRDVIEQLQEELDRIDGGKNGET